MQTKPWWRHILGGSIFKRKEKESGRRRRVSNNDSKCLSADVESSGEQQLEQGILGPSGRNFIYRDANPSQVKITAWLAWFELCHSDSKLKKKRSSIYFYFLNHKEHKAHIIVRHKGRIRITKETIQYPTFKTVFSAPHKNVVTYQNAHDSIFWSFLAMSTKNN